LEQYRKQAKNLVTDRAQAVPAALARIRHYHPRLREFPDLEIQRASFKLSDAQLIIAREHAFKSWPEFAKHVAKLQGDSISSSAQTSPFVERVHVDGMEIDAEIVVPDHARGLVLFAHASGSGRYSPRNRSVAAALHHGALGTVHIDLLTQDE